MRISRICIGVTSNVCIYERLLMDGQIADWMKEMLAAEERKIHTGKTNFWVQGPYSAPQLENDVAYAWSLAQS